MFDIREYFEPETIQEACAVLRSHPEAKIIAGGTDVLIKVREGKMAGATLVSIGKIPALHGVTIADDGTIRVGACTSFTHITNDPIIQKYIPILGEAVDKVGGPQVRNAGTIGGNICNGAVSADSAPSVFSLEADLELLSSEGSRVVPVEEFYLGPGKTDVRPGEILTAVLFHKEKYAGFSGCYIKYSMREAMDIASLSCTVVCKLDQAKTHIEDIRITFGVAAPTPLRCRDTEEKLRGQKVDEALFTLIENGIRSEINPRDSWRASRRFRLQIGGEIAKRALEQALAEQEA